MTQWWVRHAGETQGPLETKAVDEAVLDGRFLRTDHVCPIGGDAWTTLAESAQFGHHYAPAQAASRGVVKKAWRSRRVAIVAVVATLCLIGVGGFIAYRKSRNPLGGVCLPSSIRSVDSVEGRSWMFVQPSEPLLASMFAEGFCGGVDVASQLAIARGQDADDQLGLGLLDWSGDAHVREALECGHRLATGISPSAMIGLSFAENSSVTIAQAGDLHLTWPRHMYSGFNGHCLLLEGSTECDPVRPAAYRNGDHWVLGTFDAISEYARTDADEAEEESTNATILRELLGRLDTADFTMAWARPNEIAWGDLCAWGAPFGQGIEFTASCFPPGQERVLTSILAKTRGYAVQRDEVASHDALRYRYVLLAHDSQAADELERDLEDLRRDWTSNVTNNEGALARMYPERGVTIHDNLWKSVSQSYLRALRNLRTERSGELVSLVVDQELTGGDAASLREFRASRAADASAAARIVEALRLGRPMAVADLAVFVGAEMAASMVAPHASAAQCAAFRNQLATIFSTRAAARTLVPEDFGTKLRLDAAFADEQCVGMPLTSVTETCLGGALDPTSMAACVEPAATP